MTSFLPTGFDPAGWLGYNAVRRTNHIAEEAKVHYFLFQDYEDASKVFDAILLAQKLTDVVLVKGVSIAHCFGNVSRSLIGADTPEAIDTVLTTVYHYHIVCVQTDNDQAANDFLEKRVSIADWSKQEKLEVRHAFQLFLKE